MTKIGCGPFRTVKSCVFVAVIVVSVAVVVVVVSGGGDGGGGGSWAADAAAAAIDGISTRTTYIRQNLSNPGNVGMKSCFP